jgi:hypothetical protein
VADLAWPLIALFDGLGVSVVRRSDGVGSRLDLHNPLQQLRLEAQLGREAVGFAAYVSQELGGGVGQRVDALADAACVLDRVGQDDASVSARGLANLLRIGLGSGDDRSGL